MDIALLKQQVYEANMELFRRNMIIYTWGNVSGIDRERGIVVIKPSGVAYETMRVDQMVMLDLETGKPIGDGLRPSSDAPTHLALYRAFKNISGVTHTHSPFAAAFCSGGARAAVLWHDPRGLLLRHGAGHAQFDRGGNRPRV